MLKIFLPGSIRVAGYLSLALGVFLSNLSIIFPLPSLAYIAAAVFAGLNPLAVVLISSAAGALGELSAYAFGMGGGILAKKVLKKYREYRKRFKEHGFIYLVILSALPYISGDIAGLIAGAFGYSPIKFLFAVFLGRIIKYGTVVILLKLGLLVIKWGPSQLF